jgi:hypothetical protein
VLLGHGPSCCPKDWPGDRPLLRELVIPFGNAGCVALFEIDDPRHISILAVRHQRQEVSTGIQISHSFRQREFPTRSVDGPGVPRRGRARP